VSGGPGHLVRRFFGVLGAHPLRPAEQAWVASLLRPAEWALFWGQAAADQRHAFACARAARAALPERDDLARAALLHDVGKRHADLGALGRSLATTLRFLRLPAHGRLAAYLAHAATGAADLAAAGAEPVVVDFARHHHAPRPEGLPSADWDVLCRVDRD
jgi:hypothetical protein